MAFIKHSLLFIVAHDDAGTTVFVNKQNDPTEIRWDAATAGSDVWSVTGGALYSAAGADITPFGFDVSLFTGWFPIARTGVVGTETRGTLDIAPDGAPSASAANKTALFNVFLTGGSVRLKVTADGTNDNELIIEARALKTADYLLDGADAKPSYPGASPTNNLDLPGSDGIANYTMTFSKSGYSTSLAETTNVLTLPAGGHAPSDAQSRNLLLTVTHATFLGTCVVPVDLHIPTDLIVLVDRTGSMAASAASDTKWNTARRVGNLFTKLFGDMAPRLSSPNGGIAGQNRKAIAKFWSSGGAQVSWEPSSGLAAASSTQALAADTPSGGTPVGAALKAATDRFAAASGPASNTKWRRRHVMILTDGMHNSGAPSLSQVETDRPTNFPAPLADGSDGNGIVLHTIRYALTSTETFDPILDTLRNSAVPGVDHNSAPDTDPLGNDNLLVKFLDALSGVLPVDRAPPATPYLVPVEDGVERAIFVTTEGAGGLSLQSSDGTQSTGSADHGDGFSWAIAEQPKPGTWVVSTTPGGSLFAIYDLALRFQCGVEEAGIGQPIKLWAELRHRGKPVSGADVRAGTRYPAESVGELLTRFTRSGGLKKALSRGYLGTAAFGREAGNLAAAGSAGPADATSLQTLLLKAAEASRGIGFQWGSGALQLNEVAPGRYEASLPGADTTNEYVRNFYFRADGLTPAGHAFARERHVTASLEPVPDASLSDVSVVQAAAAGGGVTFQITVVPKTAAAKPVGPGLSHYLAFRYLNFKDRDSLPALQTVDNLDGSYATTLTLPQGRGLPPIGLFPVTTPNGAQTGYVPVEPGKRTRGAVHEVKVTLNALQVLDDKDPFWLGPGELAFDAIVAPNGNPHRAVRRRIPARGAVRISSGETVKVDEVLFEGLVEEGASLSVSLAGSEFDLLAFFWRREQKLARYHRAFPLKPGKHVFAPDDEPNDPETLRDWRVWYTVEVK